MKKIALILAFILCFSVLPTAYAEGAILKTYNTNLTIGADGTVTNGGSDVVSVDGDKYRLLAECDIKDQAGLVFTKPGFAIGYFSCKNEDQTPGEKIPIPMSVNYEVVIVQQRYEADGLTKVDEFAARDVERAWLDGGNPQVVSGGGDYEWAYLQVTQAMIDAAGGSFEVVFMARASMYLDTPVDQLGQLYTGYIHAYEETATLLGTQNVLGTYQGAAADTVYQVDITWGSMEFTYIDGGKGTWNPITHSYEGQSQGTWSCEDGANVITVSNSSNAAVEVGLSYTAGADRKDITALFAGEDGTAVTTLNLGSADNGLGENGAGKATVGWCSLEITGGSLKAEDTNVTLGTVSVTLN